MCEEGGSAFTSPCFDIVLTFFERVVSVECVEVCFDGCCSFLCEAAAARGSSSCHASGKPAWQHFQIL